MLDIPVLGDMICWELGRSDLAECARVNKKWHTVAISHLWRDLSWINQEHVLSTAFLKMIQEDYRAEQVYRELPDVE